MLPPTPFGNPAFRFVLDAIVVSYALWFIAGPAIILLLALLRQLGLT